MTKNEADDRLNYVRGLPMRLLGDRTLQRVAWKIADERGWPDTFDAEYVALTRLRPTPWSRSTNASPARWTAS